MHFDMSRNKYDWWVGFLWNRATGLEVQLGPIAVWVFRGKKR